MWDEDRLHRWLATLGAPPVLSGSRGHDAAVLVPENGRRVLCVDATVEGVHALLGVAPSHLGRKAAARALSDLAATAAAPGGLGARHVALEPLEVAQLVECLSQQLAGL